MTGIFEKMAEATPEEMEEMMEESGTIQDILTNHDFYIIDAKIEEIARAFGLLELGLDKDVTELSGGQRTKVLLAKLLLEKPDILLLDEPTNYLDANHIEWLRRYLQDYDNAFILISHDMEFLNSVVNLIYHMENQEINRYVGNYEKFKEVYEVKKSQLEAAYRRQQQEMNELKDFVARNKARHEIWPCRDRKNLIKWKLLNWQRKNQSRSFALKRQELPERLFLRRMTW